ncbi:hypothetical protein QFZ79_001032 [Arthrobacter sp. V4I6]|uniref:hypothetical protein n=1 Tax=unclassified Arthrobacter TaxID=235627 RepID=UPI00278245B9|nr:MULTISPECIES: hypothetical protein [unclassified Arthrobacter]MDQ0823290.1 hypothetical protein [Arthrobacter sp. V1I7]MDQ0852921.1 hypothetical protein [Arthrobacter sp. V4I6]
MTIDPNGYTPDGQLPRAIPLQCTDCGTDRHLSIRSIESLRPYSETLVAVSYTCTACGQFLAHAADVAHVAVILNRRGRRTPDVLVFGGHYIHCGRPMQKAGSEMHRFYSPIATDQASEDVLAVYLSTRVLRCSCGFQMELPE